MLGHPCSFAAVHVNKTAIVKTNHICGGSCLLIILIALIAFLHDVYSLNDV